MFVHMTSLSFVLTTRGDRVHRDRNTALLRASLQQTPSRAAGPWLQPLQDPLCRCRARVHRRQPFRPAARARLQHLQPISPAPRWGLQAPQVAFRWPSGRLQPRRTRPGSPGWQPQPLQPPSRRPGGALQPLQPASHRPRAAGGRFLQQTPGLDRSRQTRVTREGTGMGVVPRAVGPHSKEVDHEVTFVGRG